MPVGASTAVMFICRTSASGTRLTTNSPTAMMLLAVSLKPRAGSASKPMASVGGAEPMMLKKLYGAALG